MPHFVKKKGLKKKIQSIFSKGRTRHSKAASDEPLTTSDVPNPEPEPESSTSGEPLNYRSPRLRSPYQLRSRDPPVTTEPEIDLKSNVYILCETNQVSILWNSAFKEHMAHGCQGFLSMRRTEVRIVSVSYCIYCDTCDFVSKSEKLYKEVDTPGKRGRKFSTLNQALGIALINSSIGPTGFREICMILGVFPGSKKSLCQLTKQASASVDQLTLESVNRARQKVMTLFPQGIDIAMDGRYNNKYAIGSFQPGTQCVFVTTEQNTKDKLVVQYGVYNKNCPEAIRLLNSGEIDKITCPDPENKTHNCEANVAYHEAIGKEGEYAKEAALTLKEAGVIVNTATSDGDCKIGGSVSEVYPEAVNLKDSIHSSKSQKKAIMKQSFSKQLFPGNAKVAKKCKSWFAEDLRQRCDAELTKAAKKAVDCKSKTDKISKMNKLLKNTPSAIISCYSGKHTLCAKHSLVCKPTNHWGKKHLASGQRDLLYFTKSDRVDTMESILKRLGPKAVAQTYLNTNTQANEAFNRKLTKKASKSITHGFNSLKGRVGAAVLEKNEGFESAVTQSQRKIGHQVSAEIKKKIHAEHVQRKKSLAKKQTKSAKQQRVNLRANKNKLYEQKGAVDMSNVSVYQKGVDINPE